ncbi:MAG: DUF1214 domain-containing protein [Chloroflexi bacterium]|nr:DUF1214 domain-containing protein [Chloroflexota bacterium]
MLRKIIVGLIPGIIVGGILAVVTADILLSVEVHAMQTTVNGWSTTMKCGVPGNNILLKAACALLLPAANLPDEGVYWTATVDGAGNTLNGQHHYILHFPPGGTPPNDAFWSLTMMNPQSLLVANPINRYSVGNLSGLAANADGSIAIHIQNAAPAGHETNWLPAPAGNFHLMLRAYQPGPSVLNGEYQVPPVQEVP